MNNHDLHLGYLVMCYSAFLSLFGPQPLGKFPFHFPVWFKLYCEKLMGGSLGHVWTMFKEQCPIELCIIGIAVRVRIPSSK